MLHVAIAQYGVLRMLAVAIAQYGVLHMLAITFNNSTE